MKTLFLKKYFSWQFSESSAKKKRTNNFIEVFVDALNLAVKGTAYGKF